MATSTSTPPAGSLPTFNGGGIEFITIYTIQDASCTAMIANNVPEEYWQYAIEHITYEFNRTQHT